MYVSTHDIFQYSLWALIMRVFLGSLSMPLNNYHIFDRQIHCANDFRFALVKPVKIRPLFFFLKRERGSPK